MSSSERWKCDVCGYIHEGESPPEVCPVCGVGADMFSPLDAPEAASAGETVPVDRWRCTVCGYVHEGESPPETCPICSVGSELFVPVEAEGPSTAFVPGAERIVVIGAGGAGLTAAEHVRKHSDAQIVLINKEPVPPYNRLNLTRYLARQLREEELFLKSSIWYLDQGVELLEGEVLRVDRSAQMLTLRGGKELKYDTLVIANGAHAFVPPIAGAQRENVTVVRTLADANAVLAVAKQNARAVVIGGGLLGLEAAAALNGQGLKVTVIEGFESLLPRQLATPAGEILREFLEGLGIEVRCAAKVQEIYGDEAARGVRLASGEEFAAEFVVISAGVRSNKYLAVLSGLETNRGILVDDSMRTSDPKIFAAGDVAEHRGIVYGLWPVALGQGAVAGANAAGQASVFTGTPPANQLKVLDLPVFSIGIFNPDDAASEIHEHRQENQYRRIVCRDGQIVGANLVGDLSLAGPLKSAIEGKLQLQELPESLRSLL